jgi:F0F1-type ATP synthase assembly protein I
MGSHPLNLVVRFALEVFALIAYGMRGWQMGESFLKIVFAAAIPTIIAVLWGVFAVSNDPSRSGKTLVETPGIIRLLMELAIFSGASWVLFNMGFNSYGLIFLVVFILHYLISIDRIKWLLSR